MTIEHLVRLVNEHLGLITAIGGVTLGLLLLWLRKYFYTRKDGEVLSHRVGQLETSIVSIGESIRHLPTPGDVSEIKEDIGKAQMHQARTSEKMIGFESLLERIESQNNQIIGCLIDRRSKQSIGAGD